ncbi:MAG: hypothetical protein WA366_08700 [Pseudolabrys sp.]|jgi:hypothetical protein
MTKRNQNFSMHVGETKTVFIKLDNEDGTLFETAGITMEWWLAKTSHSDKIVQKKPGEGLVLSPGGVSIVLAPADTYDLRPELYYHELKINIGSTGLSVSTVGTAHLRPAPRQTADSSA